MSDIVDPNEIEALFGIPRPNFEHLIGVKRYMYAGEWIETMYIYHSQRCIDTGGDLRQCPFSIAMDRGRLIPNYRL